MSLRKALLTPSPHAPPRYVVVLKATENKVIVRDYGQELVFRGATRAELRCDECSEARLELR